MDHFLSCFGGLEDGFWVLSGGAAAEKSCLLEPEGRAWGALRDARFVPGTLLSTLHAASRLPPESLMVSTTMAPILQVSQ